MKRKILLYSALSAVFALGFIMVVTLGDAKSAGVYTLTWNTIDGGGGMNSTGGAYTLSGTIGQPDAGVLGGGSYTLVGGFWNSSLGQRQLYLPLIMK